MKCVAVVVLLSFLSLGHSAPLSSCESLVKPITISNEDMLGRWLYIGGTSRRSLGYLLNSAWLNITATPQSNILNLLQSQRIDEKDECSSLTYNVTFENSTMLIEQPFYLKDVYLATNCSDCLVVYEEVTSGNDTFTSLLLFSRRKSVSPAALKMFKRQAECLQMPLPKIIDTDYEICPDNISPSEGLTALNSLFEVKKGNRVLKLLEAMFD